MRGTLNTLHAEQRLSFSEAKGTLHNLTEQSSQTIQRLTYTAQLMSHAQRQVTSTLDRILEFQNILSGKRVILDVIRAANLSSGDFLDFKVLLGYLLVLILLFFLTTCQRTERARVFLLIGQLLSRSSPSNSLIVFFVCMATEKSASNSGSSSSQEVIWYIRRLGILIGCSIMVWAICSYKDYASINHHLLNDILRRLDQEIPRVSPTSRRSSKRLA